jgi:hypothetical protein
MLTDTDVADSAKTLCLLTHACAGAPRAAPRREFMAAADSAWAPASIWASDAHPAGRTTHDDSAPSHGLSQVVLEGSLVNLDVTSPAATLAFALMFLQTNDKSAAEMLVLPDSTFTLDFVRPFYILLRILARALILWDAVEPTEAWVYAQLPEVLRATWEECLQPMQDALADGREFDWEAVLLGHIHGVAGAALALGLRYAGVALAALPACSACTT